MPLPPPPPPPPPAAQQTSSYSEGHLAPGQQQQQKLSLPTDMIASQDSTQDLDAHRYHEAPSVPGGIPLQITIPSPVASHADSASFQQPQAPAATDPGSFHSQIYNAVNTAPPQPQYVSMNNHQLAYHHSHHHHHQQQLQYTIPPPPPQPHYQQQSYEYHHMINAQQYAAIPQTNYGHTDHGVPPPVPQPSPMHTNTMAIVSHSSSVGIAPTAPAPQHVPGMNPVDSNMGRPSLISRSSSVGACTPSGEICPQCGRIQKDGSDNGQMEIARRKLELMQEKVEVDQLLLKQEKKNFKLRLKAAKLSIAKAQQEAAGKERQRQLEWNKLHAEMNEKHQKKLQHKQQEFEMKLTNLEIDTADQKRKYEIEVQSLQETVSNLQEEVDAAIAARNQERSVSSALQRKMQETVAPNAAQQEKIEQLERDLEDQQHHIDSLEMQLLDLERERDTGGLRGSGGKLSSNEASCGRCLALDRQLSEAKLQLDTLQNRQTITDQKLSAERRKYEDLRVKWEAAEAERQAERSNNEQRLRMAKDVKDLQQQLKEVKLREQESASTRKMIEQVMTSLQQENEQIQENIDKAQKEKEELEVLLKEEKEKAQDAIATATALQRVLEDKNATVDVSLLPTLSKDSHRKLVMEYEWHGPDMVGIYTGQLSIKTNNPDGNGTLRLEDGAVYDGEWVDGRPHGSGVWATIEGDLFTCRSWQSGKKHGFTVDVLSDGQVYRGEYQHGQRHGHGVLTWPYGAHYEGQFVNNKRNGEGRYCYADGRVYTGNYKDDRPHGYGIMKAEDGTIIYDGTWQLGEFIGNDEEKKT
jgi:hypothetical protein